MCTNWYCAAMVVLGGCSMNTNHVGPDSNDDGCVMPLHMNLWHLQIIALSSKNDDPLTHQRVCKQAIYNTITLAIYVHTYSPTYTLAPISSSHKPYLAVWGTRKVRRHSSQPSKTSLLPGRHPLSITHKLWKLPDCLHTPTIQSWNQQMKPLVHNHPTATSILCFRMVCSRVRSRMPRYMFVQDVLHCAVLCCAVRQTVPTAVYATGYLKLSTSAQYRIIAMSLAQYLSCC
jgi:hypothetical protein